MPSKLAFIFMLFSINNRSGFTLIELSIVLVIIGLVIGGIMVGQDMIHASQIRKTISEIQSIDTAITTFREKYNCLPGDCPNASSFFAGQVCDGTGDGKIYDYLSNYAQCGANNGLQERHGVFISLLLAGLLPALGITTTAFATYADERQHAIPAASIAPGSYNVSWYDFFATPLGYAPQHCFFCATGYSDNYIVIGKLYNGSYGWADNGNALSVNDAISIDTKIDDGRARGGKIRGGGPNTVAAGTWCTTANTPYEWDISDTGTTCGLAYRITSH